MNGMTDYFFYLFFWRIRILKHNYMYAMFAISTGNRKTVWYLCTSLSAVTSAYCCFLSTFFVSCFFFYLFFLNEECGWPVRQIDVSLYST